MFESVLRERVEEQPTYFACTLNLVWTFNPELDSFLEEPVRTVSGEDVILSKSNREKYPFDSSNDELVLVFWPFTGSGLMLSSFTSLLAAATKLEKEPKSSRKRILFINSFVWFENENIKTSWRTIHLNQKLHERQATLRR